MIVLTEGIKKEIVLSEGIKKEMLADVKHIGKLSFLQEELVGQEHQRSRDT